LVVRNTWPLDVVQARGNAEIVQSLWLLLPWGHRAPRRAGTTRQTWEITDLDGFLASGQFPVLSQNADSHQVVVDELPRRPSSG
jgi:hypothetical protein